MSTKQIVFISAFTGFSAGVVLSIAGLFGLAYYGDRFDNNGRDIMRIHAAPHRTFPKAAQGE